MSATGETAGLGQVGVRMRSGEWSWETFKAKDLLGPGAPAPLPMGSHRHRSSEGTLQRFEQHHL